MVQSKGKKKIKKHGLLPMLSQACMLQITRTCNSVRNCFTFHIIPDQLGTTVIYQLYVS